MTKKITFIFPEAVGIIDMTYYWKNETGTTKTVAFFDGSECADGDEVNCYLPVTEQKEET